jgi:uncharacterized protein YjbI with pentapeptide repeats
VSLPLDVPKGTISEPHRTTVPDAHFGDALFRLNAWTHFFVALTQGWLTKDGRERTASELWDDVPSEQTNKYQTSVGAFKLFRPTGEKNLYWQNYVSRINAAGWRPDGQFPSGCSLAGVDFSHCTVADFGAGAPSRWSFANFTSADLESANLGKDTFVGCLFRNAQLSFAFMDGATLEECEFDGTSYGASLWDSAKLTRCSLREVFFRHVSLFGVLFDNCDLRGAIFDHAILTAAKLVECQIEGTVFTHGTLLIGADLSTSYGVPRVSGQILIVDEIDSLPSSFSSAQIIVRSVE